MPDTSHTCLQLTSELEKIFSYAPYKIVVSSPREKDAEKRLSFECKGNIWQLEYMEGPKAFHNNYTQDELSGELYKLLIQKYTQVHVFGLNADSSLRISKKGKVLSSRKPPSNPSGENAAHNREKNYLVAPGTVVPALVDMGVMTSSGQIVKSMYAKFRQINRFVEIIDDVMRQQKPESIRVVDFGCGKSYLTFILYHYFSEILKIPVRMTGLDLKQDVVQKCNEAAKKYGYSQLDFQIGNISDFNSEDKIDMVVTLHACDTATDYALAKAVEWGAPMIFSAPCCQHELNSQFKTSELALLSKYGIIQERTSALITDAIRGALLESRGYKTQIIEFVDFAHTPKNLLIRALKSNIPAAKKQSALEQVHQTCKAFNLQPTLLELLHS